jgi:hypothetical protein
MSDRRPAQPELGRVDSSPLLTDPEDIGSDHERDDRHQFDGDVYGPTGRIFERAAGCGLLSARNAATMAPDSDVGP